MSNQNTPTLRVREDLYLAAMAFLGDLEGCLGDDVSPFSISDAGHRFVLSDRTRDLFETETGHTMTSEEYELTDRFFMGMQAPTHYNQSLEQYTDGIWDVDETAADTIRDVVFSFTTAWSHRYGGFSHARTRNGVVIALGDA